MQLLKVIHKLSRLLTHGQSLETSELNILDHMLCRQRWQTSQTMELKDRVKLTIRAITSAHFEGVLSRRLSTREIGLTAATFRHYLQL